MCKVLTESDNKFKKWTDNHDVFVYLQDTYDITEDDEPEEHEHHSHDASSDNFYDAPAADKDASALPEVRIDLSASDDPQDRLIAAIAALREVIVDNTNVQRTTKRRRGQERAGGGGGGNSRSSGGQFKDERLKVRKEKVSGHVWLLFQLMYACSCCNRALEQWGGGWSSGPHGTLDSHLRISEFKIWFRVAFLCNNNTTGNQ